MKTRTMMITISVLAAGLLLVACGGMEPQPEDSVESIQKSLELEENGGYSMLDEAPAFGLPELDMVALDPNLMVPELPEEMMTEAGVLPNKSGVVVKPPCPHGLLKGKWKQLKNGYGVFKGKWASANGKVTGHLKGIYGKNLKGNGVFFGKYIADNGKAMGLIKGRYGKQHFKAIWHGVHGGKGVIHGAYGEAKCVKLPNGTKKCLPGKGVFVGKWRAFCPKCLVKCAPGFVQPPNHCICVPAKVIPCLKGNCPQGMYCDPCALLPGCKPNMPCAALCAPPVCRPKPMPPMPPMPPQTK
jgi:hypothetical protein